MNANPEPTYYSGPPVIRPAVYVTVGHRETYVIIFSAPKYPEVFATREAADKRSAVVGRPVVVRLEPIRKRVTP